MSPKLGIEFRDKVIEIFSEFEDDQVYFQVLNLMLSINESDYGIFGYITKNGDLVLPSFTKEVWKKCQIPHKTQVFPHEDWANSNGLWARAIVEGKTQYTNQSLKPPEGHIPMSRAIAVPILYQKKVIGMLSVANKSSDYTKDDIKGIEKFASYISPLLNARLEREMQLKELKKLRKESSNRYKKVELDNIDKQILRQLYSDGRESKPIIARNLDMSHTGIQNRIRKLEESNILKIQGNINLKPLAIRVAYMNIEFASYDFIDEFLNKFSKCPRIFLISRITGKYHIKIGLIGKSIDDLNSFINYCLFPDKKLINSTEIIFASDLTKPKFLPVNLFNIHDNDTPCGRNCLDCEAYINEICFGCDFL